MTANEAAESLYDELSRFRWLVSVGIGNPDGRETLYVYVTTIRHPELEVLRNGYRGFPVIVTQSGAVRPAAGVR